MAKVAGRLRVGASWSPCSLCRPPWTEPWNASLAQSSLTGAPLSSLVLRSPVTTRARSPRLPRSSFGWRRSSL
eukprot:3413264-Alexandrium_andersonii.AAC.1